MHRFGRLVPAFCLTLAACAPQELVVLLPGEGGTTGAVAVRSKQGAGLVLDSPHSAARIGAGGEAAADWITEQEIRRHFAAALAAQPPAPRSFTLYFETGTVRLTQASRPELDKLLAEVGRRQAVEVQITGHADRVGTVANNDRLSRRRAAEVQEVLDGLGLRVSRMRAVGRGEREPLVATADGVPEPRNRRVEVTVR